VNGYYERLMRQQFHRKPYGRRWRIETALSMLNRSLGSALKARSYHSQSREIRLPVLTHDLMTLRRQQHVLYGA